ncbi:MAG: toprim domain-containing protein [Rubrivivax sp.]|nr:toprim domain-containing protein [Rubrivivax sp.]
MADPVQAFRAAILAALGHAPEEIEPGKFQRFGTSVRRADDAGWCKLFHDLRGGVFGCYRQGVSETWSATDRATMTREQRAELARQVMTATAEREAQQRQQWAENAQRIALLWAECVPLVAGDPVTLYLKRRGFGGVWPLPGALRLHRALPYWHGAEKLGTFPAMVAPLVAPDGRMVALHRTYLTRDGRKADVPTVKKLTGAAGPLAGACIPLHKPARGCIGIAEGIETALAAWCAAGVPTVAAYCAGNLAAWRWPGGVQRLVIFADADKAGREAADTLRARALSAGLRAEVLTPSADGADWCDVWADRGAALIEAGGAA